MKNLSLLLLLVFIGCNTPEIKKESPQGPVALPEIPKVPPLETPKENTEAHAGEASEYTAPVKPLPSATGTFTTNIVTQKCPTDYVKKVEEAASTYIKPIMNSEDFRDAVGDFTYNGKKQFVDNEKMKNSDIYKHLIGGAEALRPTLNYQMDLLVECYTDNSKNTVGYTYPSKNQIWVNMKYHKSYSSAKVSSNIIHEWSHKMGFTHAVNWSKSRDYSVPYGLNSIVEKLAPKAKAGKLTPLKGSDN